MSVIHSAVDWSGRRLASSLIERMIPASDYWQPDQLAQQHCPEGQWALAKALLYNAPLSKDAVISGSGGKLQLCANARLDNRDKLLDKLAVPRPQWQNFSDGQLILRAYQHWGESCAKYLLGDFVFAIWDQDQQKLFCARDHLGVKVLFYTFKNGVALVSNEHNALVKTGVVDAAIKQRWLVQGLWGLAQSAFASPYRDIHVLPAAHTLVINADGATLNRYWQLEDKDIGQGRSEHDLLAELDQRFRTAVQRRLCSDYPLGAELSEGLDSCGIAGVAAQQLETQPLYTFSYECIEETDQSRPVWGETYRDIYAMLATHPNLTPVWQATEDNSLRDSDELTRFEQLFGGPTNFHGFDFLRPALASAKGVRTMLSGWGGDHCVTSYGDFYESELLSQGRLADTHQLFKHKQQRGRGAKPAKAWIVLLLKHLAPFVYRRVYSRRRGLGQSMLRRAGQHYLKTEYRQRHRLDKALRDFVDNYACYSVKSRDWRELFNIGLENRLVESELSGRVNRVEFRFPMLDVELLEFAYNVPAELKIKQGIERFMFRQLLEGVTTERIRWRCKADVAHPNRDRGSRMAELQSHVLKNFDIEKSAAVKRYCDPHKLQAIIDKYQHGFHRGLNLLSGLDDWLAKGAFIVDE